VRANPGGTGANHAVLLSVAGPSGVLDCWLDDVKVEKISGRYGSKSHYVNIILKTSSKPINITFAKKEICEKIRELLLKKKYKSKK